MENLNKSTAVNSDAFIEFMGKALNLRPDQVIERVYRNTSEDMLGLNKSETETWGDRESGPRHAESGTTCAVCGANESVRGYGPDKKIKLCDGCAKNPMPIEFLDALSEHADAGGGSPFRGSGVAPQGSTQGYADAMRREFDQGNRKSFRSGDLSKAKKWKGDPMADFEDARWARQDEGPVGSFGVGALPKMMNTSIGPVSEGSVDRAEAAAAAKQKTKRAVREAKREGRRNGFEASFVDKSGGRARLPGRDTGMLKAPEEDDEDPRDAKRRREEAVANRVEQELQQSFSPRKLAQFGKSVNSLEAISHRMTSDFGR